MATVALTQPDGTLINANKALAGVKERITQGLDHRRRNYEPGWHVSMAFAAGSHWNVWDRDMRALRRIEDVDPRYAGRELYQADVVQEYRGTALGELANDNDRPELLLQRDDEASEEYQAQANRGLGYLWDIEARADEVLEQADELMVDLGTSAIRCRWDPNAGPPMAREVPHQDGRPILELAAARDYVASQQTRKQSADLRQINQGQATWEALSAFNLIVPPGVTNERFFPWECVVRPTLLSDVQEEFGAAAAELKEDRDIASTLGIEVNGRFGGESPAESYATGEGRQTRLRDHVWLYTYYERPNKKFPRGRVLIFAGKDMRLMQQYPELPYVAPDGTYRSGITYFHWWRVSGRFWGRGLVESLKDGQRTINKRRTQQNEIIDRSMPFILVGKDSEAKKRTGVPAEFVELGNNERPPTVVPGVPPGPWFQADVEAIREDIQHATGMRDVSLGENPANIKTYGQLALTNENEKTKRENIRKRRRRGIKQLVEDSVYDMRTYWGPTKQLLLAGDDDQAEATTFNATRIPAWFIVKVADGDALPRTQGAQLKLIEDVVQYSALVQQPIPPAMYAKSLQAGELLELPETPTSGAVQKAEMENHFILQGDLVKPFYADPLGVHLPIHREAQTQAELAGDTAAVQRFEQHIQESFAVAQEQLLQAHQLAQPPGPPAGQPTSPPGAAEAALSTPGAS